MGSARRLSRFGLAFGAVAVGAVLLAGAAAVSRVEFSVPAGEQLLAACTRALPSVTLSTAAVLAVLGLVAAVALRGARAGLRQWGAQRRLRQGLRIVDGGQSCGVRFDVIAGDSPQAFCAGLLRPRVYVSQGAVDAVGGRQLAAVLAHEDHHRRRRDPLRLAAGAVVAEAVFFVPALRRLHERYRSVAELAADEAAVVRTDASTLASALLRFAPAERSAAVGIAPERVDHLLGERPGWQLPWVLLVGSLGSLGALVVLVAVAVAGSAAAGTVNVPMVLMGSCILLMSLGVVAATVAAGVVVRRRRA